MTDETATETHSEPTPDRHASDAMTGPHGSMGDHGADHGHDDHAHAAEDNAKIDLPAWAAGILGVLLGLAVVAIIAIASGNLH